LHHHSFARQRKLKPKLITQLLMGLFLPLLLQPANAVEVTKQITAKAGVEYDSNPNMVETNRNPVWIYTFTPQLLLNATDEANRWYLDAALLVQRYSNEKVIADREDPKLTVGWDHLYESGFFGIKADYQESSSLVAQLKATGVFTNVNASQKTKALAAKWQHEINPRWTVLTEGSYTDVVFNQGGGNQGGGVTPVGSLQSYNISEIGSNLTYAYTEKLDTSVKLDYAHYHPDVLFDDTDLVRLVLGAKYQINEGLTLAAHAGPYNRSGQQSDTNWEGGIQARYIAQRMDYTAELKRALVPAGIGGFQKEDTLNLGWLFNISERDQVGADYYWNNTKKDTDINLLQLKYRQVGAFYGRTLSNHWQSRFYGYHKEQDSPGIHSQGNVIGVSVVYDTLSF